MSRRWHLAVIGQKDGTLYVANGVLLTILFFASRVVSYGAGMWHLWGLRSESLSLHHSCSTTLIPTCIAGLHLIADSRPDIDLISLLESFSVTKMEINC